MLFLSYARGDLRDRDRVVGVLRALRQEVWFDGELAGGQDWWDVILGRIRSGAGVVALVSPAMLRSPACLAEVDYALRLNVPVLPVAVRDFPAELLPPRLARLHVERLDDGQESGLRFAGALISLLTTVREQRETEPPPAPLSYLTELADRLRAPSLTPDEQYALLARLDTAAETGRDRELLAELVTDFGRRDDLLHTVARRLERLAADIEGAGTAPEPVRRWGPPPVEAGSEPVRVIRVSGQGGERTFVLGTGRTRAELTFQLHPLKGNELRLDGVRIVGVRTEPVTARKAQAVHRFGLPLGRRVEAELRYAGFSEIVGLELRMDGVLVHKEGRLG